MSKILCKTGLLLALRVKFSADNILIFFFLSQKTCFAISCKLSPMEAYFVFERGRGCGWGGAGRWGRWGLGAGRENIINLLPAELAEKAVKVNKQIEFDCTGIQRLFRDSSPVYCSLPSETPETVTITEPCIRISSELLLKPFRAATFACIQF